MARNSGVNFCTQKVEGKRSKKAFAQVLRVLYKDDPEWICPPDRHIEKIFDPLRNPVFQFGTACRWILKDSKGNLKGRIAAFVNEKKNKSLSFPVGGVGFFECIDDYEGARLLLDTAAGWLRERKMDAMDGPINFGENDRYWGLLVEGFTAVPFTTNYNKPYYRALMEEYGFETYYEMYSSEIDLSKKLDPRFSEIASWLSQKNDFVFRCAESNNLPEFAEYFREIYNDAWKFHDGFSPITPPQSRRFASEMRHVIIDYFCPFAFVRGEPAAFIIAAPDLNQIFRPFKGKVNFIRLLQFKWRSRNNYAWYRRKGILTRGHAIAIGVKPKFQQYGIETGMMMKSIEAIRDLGFKTVELRWAGDFNPGIIRLHKAVGAARVRKHITLRYMFNRGIRVVPPELITMGKKNNAKPVYEVP
jgi:hypothetical protein